MVVCVVLGGAARGLQEKEEPLERRAGQAPERGQDAGPEAPGLQLRGWHGGGSPRRVLLPGKKPGLKVGEEEKQDRPAHGHPPRRPTAQSSSTLL